MADLPDGRVLFSGALSVVAVLGALMGQLRHSWGAPHVAMSLKERATYPLPPQAEKSAYLYRLWADHNSGAVTGQYHLTAYSVIGLMLARMIWLETRKKKGGAQRTQSA